MVSLLPHGRPKVNPAVVAAVKKIAPGVEEMGRRAHIHKLVEAMLNKTRVTVPGPRGHARYPATITSIDANGRVEVNVAPIAGTITRIHTADQVEVEG